MHKRLVEKVGYHLQSEEIWSSAISIYLQQEDVATAIDLLLLVQLLPIQSNTQILSQFQTHPLLEVYSYLIKNIIYYFLYLFLLLLLS